MDERQHGLAGRGPEPGDRRTCAFDVIVLQAGTGKVVDGTVPMSSHAASSDAQRSASGPLPAAVRLRWFFVAIACGVVLPSLLAPLSSTAPTRHANLVANKADEDSGASPPEFLIDALREKRGARRRGDSGRDCLCQALRARSGSAAIVVGRRSRSRQHGFAESIARRLRPSQLLRFRFSLRPSR